MKTGQKLAVLMTSIGVNLQTAIKDHEEPEKLLPPIDAFNSYDDFDDLGKLCLAKMSSNMASDCAKLALMMALIEDPNSEVFAMVSSLFDQAANLIMDDLGIPA